MSEHARPSLLFHLEHHTQHSNQPKHNHTLTHTHIYIYIYFKKTASPRVSGRCFGARLMLEPPRVGRIVREMQRRATLTPITVKCRIGADDRDS